VGRLRRAARSSLAALRRKRDADTLRNDAAIALLAGNCKRAAAELAEAVTLDAKSAPAWSDLAAARLECAQAASDPYQLVLALAAANRAVSEDSSLSEPHFNRAIALGRMSLAAAALADWRLLVADERDRGWAQEAASRATGLSAGARPPSWERAREEVQTLTDHGKPSRISGLVAQWPQRFREHVEEDLLASWAEAEMRGRTTPARRQLAAAEAIAGALVAVNGERVRNMEHRSMTMIPTTRKTPWLVNFDSKLKSEIWH
jgi:hypothetical protein